MKKIILIFLCILISLFALLYFFRDTVIDFSLEGGYQSKFDSKILGEKLLERATITLPINSEESEKPVILMLHGCGGKFNHQDFWAEKFLKLGFPSVILDSYSIREDIDKGRVCKGRGFFGPERSADVLAVVSQLKYIDSLKSRKVVLAGWSHGGWTAMESISTIHNQISHSLLEDSFSLNSDIILGSIIFYPYCGSLSKFARYEWPNNFQSLMILVDNDRVLDHKDCVDVIKDKELGDNISYVVIEDTHHAFDFPPGLEKFRLKNDPVATDKSIELVENYLKRLD